MRLIIILLFGFLSSTSFAFLAINDSSVIKPSVQIIGLEDRSAGHLEFTKDLEFTSSNNYLTIHYIGSLPIEQSGRVYNIILQNLSEGTEESHFTHNSYFHIRGLQAGSYKIGVAAGSPYGVWSDTLFTSTITISKPLSQQWWFYFFLFLAVSVILYVIIDYFNKRKMSKILEKEVKRRQSLLDKSESNIRVLTKQLFLAQEKERERIARELHDNIAQDLTHLRIEIDKLIDINPKDDDSLEKLYWMSEKINHVIKSVKDLSYFLHPSMLKQMGLVNSMMSLCKDLTRSADIKTEFFSSGLENISLDLEIEINLYRFMQEALSNIRKHARARKVSVIIMLNGNILTARVEDDGVGFDYNKAVNRTDKRTLGIKSMEERMKLIKGELTIKTGKDEGTKLIARIPLESKDYSTSLVNASQALG